MKKFLAIISMVAFSSLAFAQTPADAAKPGAVGGTGTGTAAAGGAAAGGLTTAGMVGVALAVAGVVAIVSDDNNAVATATATATGTR